MKLRIKHALWFMWHLPPISTRPNYKKFRYVAQRAPTVLRSITLAHSATMLSAAMLAGAAGFGAGAYAVGLQAFKSTKARRISGSLIPDCHARNHPRIGGPTPKTRTGTLEENLPRRLDRQGDRRHGLHSFQVRCRHCRRSKRQHL